MFLQRSVVQAFARRFGVQPSLVVRAPGRLNLIGEHTDYNNGFVLLLAIDRARWIALRPRDDCEVIVHSLELDETTGFALSDFVNTGASWFEYVKGVAWSLQEPGGELRLRVFVGPSMADLFITRDCACLVSDVYPQRPHHLGVDRWPLQALSS